jgi:hypothetical protein
VTDFSRFGKYLESSSRSCAERGKTCQNLSLLVDKMNADAPLTLAESRNGTGPFSELGSGHIPNGRSMYCRRRRHVIFHDLSNKGRPVTQRSWDSTTLE